MRRAITLIPGTLALAALAACVGPRPDPVRIPVPVPCIEEAPAKPTYPVFYLAPGTGEMEELFARVQWLLAERELRMAYEAQMEAVIRACD